jgi:hypothetical protein
MSADDWRLLTFIAFLFGATVGAVGIVLLLAQSGALA